MFGKSTLIAAILAMAAGLAVAQPAVNPKVATPPAVQPDQVEKFIAAGLAAYKQNKPGDAIDNLQKAIAMLQQSLQKGLAGFLPPVPEGWEADEIDSQSASYGAGGSATSWTVVSRSYKRKSDELRVTVQFTNSPELIQAQQGMAAAYRNPQMLAMMNQNPDTRVSLIDSNGWFGWRAVNKDSDATAVAFHSKVMATVNVDKDDQQILDTFWNAINLQGLAAQSQTQQTAPAAPSAPATPAR